jgi:hypothetical protein
VEVDTNTFQGSSQSNSGNGISSRFRFLTSVHHQQKHAHRGHQGQHGQYVPDIPPKTEEEFMMKDSFKLLEKVQRMIETTENNVSKDSIVFIDLC